MINNYLLYIIILFVSKIGFGIYKSTGNENNDKLYPVPPKTEKLLFYVQRSHNRNTIVYDLNTMTNGEINLKEPIHPYWIRYEEGGNREELTYLQRKYAYGLNLISADKKNESFIFNFICYKKRNIYLMRTGDKHRFKACMFVNGTLAALNKIFIKHEDGLLFHPVVKYLDISGIEIKTGIEVKERLIP
ncbi:MAG: DUF4833 domain-containing protein [Bacteroidota bacterium]|nr:DUF4833 domain-containing protein [Bacteroidota bacterium]